MLIETDVLFLPRLLLSMIIRNILAGDAAQHGLVVGDALQYFPVGAVVYFLLDGDAVFCEPLHVLCLVVQLEGFLAFILHRIHHTSLKTNHQRKCFGTENVEGVVVLTALIVLKHLRQNLLDVAQFVHITEYAPCAEQRVCFVSDWCGCQCVKSLAARLRVLVGLILLYAPVVVGEM